MSQDYSQRKKLKLSKLEYNSFCGKVNFGVIMDVWKRSDNFPLNMSFLNISIYSP